MLQVIDEYQKNFGESWRAAQADSTQPWPYLNEALTKFQVTWHLFSLRSTLAAIYLHFLFHS